MVVKDFWEFPLVLKVYDEIIPNGHHIHLFNIFYSDRHTPVARHDAIELETSNNYNNNNNTWEARGAAK